MKLNQAIAVLKGTKERTHQEISKLYQSLTATETFTGFSKTFKPKAEDGDQLPPENKIVQRKIEDVFDALKNSTGELIDLHYTHEVGNTQAYADLALPDGTTIPKVPVGMLVRLEKELVDVRTFISKSPTFAIDVSWSWNEDRLLWSSDSVTTTSTKKVPTFITVADATEHHPAQVREVSNDLIVGHWTKQEFSATLSPARKKELLDRVNILIDTVKKAREEANMTEIKQMKMGAALFSYLFA
jgi:hypothetical protein